MLDDFNFIVFSHSDYSYLWPIIEDYVVNISQLNPIFVCNKNNTIERPKGFCKYIEYDDNLCYSQRWINILHEIDSKYILVIHDVVIILNCDVSKINKLVNVTDKHKIDRCSMNVFDGIQTVYDNNMYLCNLNNRVVGRNYTPYDVSPAIWNKSSFLKLWHTFPNETYRNSEQNPSVQEYCKKLKCYGLQKTNERIYYSLSRPNYEMFKVLHITIQGEITFPIEVYMDTIEDFTRIFERYNLKDKIKINYNYGFVLQNHIPI
jgi:hypothetical protein